MEEAPVSIGRRLFDRHDSFSMYSVYMEARRLLSENTEGIRGVVELNPSMFDPPCDSASSTVCDVIVHGICCCFADHCLVQSQADLCSHVRQQVRMST